MTLLDLQHDDGRWEGEVVWNTMILSQYLITHRLLDRDLSEVDIKAARKHYERTRMANGSWPFHVEAEEGSLYVTTLAYVALRLTGTPPEDLARTRQWMHARPHGVAGIPAWGRMWLATLGLFPYEAINPIPPELALLPVVRRLYCHTRYIYLGLAYLYGTRFSRPLMPELADELRIENPRRHVVDPGDLVEPPHRVLRFLYDLLKRVRPVGWLRRIALRRCADELAAELAASGGIGISPVSGLLSCLVLNRDPASMNAWRWLDSAGLRIAGARSSTWDTAFAMRALLAGDPPATELARAHRWLLGQQIMVDVPANRLRDSALGGWAFSDGTNWPVSDCAAEVLSALLDTDDAIGTLTPPERAHAAARFILARQNPDGGFGTYERARAPRWVERLNPSEMYTGCMTDLSHVEVTASCVSALVRYRRRWPGREVDSAIERGVAHLRSRQRPDGAYPAAWGINFTYAAFFVVEALTEAGVPADDPALKGLADWLLRHQREDGGWGEHHSSGRTGEYVPHPRGQRTMTAWALLALVPLIGADHPAVIRGVTFVGWPQTIQDAASGVFFGTAVLDYRLYREVFPVWATNVVEGFMRQPS